MKEYSGRVKGIKVDPIDTTGAGDAFVAGILSQLSIDLSIIQVLHFKYLNNVICISSFILPKGDCIQSWYIILYVAPTI